MKIIKREKSGNTRKITLFGKVSFKYKKKDSFIKKIKTKYKLLYPSIIRYIDGEWGEQVRYNFYKKRLKYLGKNVKIDTGVFLYGEKYISIDDNTHIDKGGILVASSPDLDLSYRALKEVGNKDINIEKGALIIGKECHISQYCMIYAYGGVKLADNCVMSTGAKIYSLNSLPENPLNKSEVVSIVPYDGVSPTIIGSVELENNVWLGINVCVFPGIKIGRDSFVRTNAVVMNSVERNSFIAGDPAVFVKKRFEKGELND